MKTIIKCEENHNGQHNFYACQGVNKYYLFTQKYYCGVDKYFKNGVIIDKAVKYDKSIHGDAMITKTINKMKPYIKYAEKEYEIDILDSTIRRNSNEINAYKLYKQCHDWY